MSDFKNEYKRAVDRLEPDSRLLESLKADMKAAVQAPPKPNFFVKYGWAFGSAAACLVVALAVGIMLSVGSREMASGGAAMNNEAANMGVAPEMVGNASYGMNGGADDAAKDIEDAADDGAMPEPENADDGDYYINTDRAEAAATTTGSVADILEPDSELSGGESDLPMPYFEPQQVEALKPLSYEELKALVMIDQSESELILSDFALYDYFEVLNYDTYYLVLRYDTSGFTFPVVAAFQWVTPSDPVIALRLYADYNDPSAYLDLREKSVDEFDYYFSPADYIYSFEDVDVNFREKDLDRLTPMTDRQFFELVNKVKQGTLALSDFFEELEFFDAGFSRYTYTFVCSYTYSDTEQGYALIAHFPGTETDTAPDQLILRKRYSLKELDLLNDYDTLGMFLA